MSSRTIQSETKTKEAAAQVTDERRRAESKVKNLVNADQTLTTSEALKVRHALKQVKAQKTKPWSQIKNELGL